MIAAMTTQKSQVFWKSPTLKFIAITPARAVCVAQNRGDAASRIGLEALALVVLHGQIRSPTFSFLVTDAALGALKHVQ
jgi:hypothetical protein